ncbi:UNVERIFIED_CONTAM: hypothetical protein GTU68_021757 [Idotea baltica]|nr:hypothetical protein [Idotea baltica]
MLDTLFPHLPALQVVLPLLAAPIALLFGKQTQWIWLFATLVSGACFVIAFQLFLQVQTGDVIRYEFGGWAAPWGIEYRIDSLNAFILLIVSGIAAVVFPYAQTSIEKEIPPQHQSLFYVLMLLCLAGLLGMTITGDAFNVFVLLEISSLSTYALIALGRDRRGLTSAFQYLVMGTIGATFILIGIGLLYILTGSLNMMNLADKIKDLHGSRTLHVAFGFLIVGFSLKLAMFPLHLWLPNAYAYAPSVVSAFLAATATKVALYAMLRFMFTIFGADYSFDTMQVQWLFMPLACIAIIVASVVAIFQSDLKRMLAYSSVAQIGYMLLGISLANVTGLTATLLHIFNHSLMKGALFLALGALCYQVGNTQFNRLAGVGKQMPWTFMAIVIGGLSLIGVPLTVGFISKWYLILASIEQGMWPIVVVIIIGSLLAVIYIWRVVEAAYFKPAENPETGNNIKEAPLMLLIPTWILVIANLGFGTYATFTADISRNIATLLFRGIQ